jgi:hypothetical protein
MGMPAPARGFEVEKMAATKRSSWGFLSFWNMPHFGCELRVMEQLLTGCK